MSKGDLFLECSQVGDVRVTKLAKAMEEGHMAEVKELNLKFNSISGVGLEALTTALTKGVLPKLRKLYLNSNEVGHGPWLTPKGFHWAPVGVWRILRTGSIGVLVGEDCYMLGNP